MNTKINLLIMSEEQVIAVLYTIYVAGFNHGHEEGAFPDTGTFEAFTRLIDGDSPRETGESYSIKEKVDRLKTLSRCSKAKEIAWGAGTAQERMEEIKKLLTD